MGSWGGEGRIDEPTMGATLPLCAHKFDSDQIVVMLGARWVPVVGKANPYN